MKEGNMETDRKTHKQKCFLFSLFHSLPRVEGEMLLVELIIYLEYMGFF